jgi:hypothetical protein
MQIGTLPIEKRPSIKKADSSIHQTHFSSLTLRLHEPYWLLHQGNCEHFLVVDQIRLVFHDVLLFSTLLLNSLTDSDTSQTPPQAIRSLSKSRPPSLTFAVLAQKFLPFGPLSGTSGSARALACCVLGAGGTWANSVKTRVSW